VAEHGARAAGKYGGELAGTHWRYSVADEIDATEQGVESAGPEAMVDRVGCQPSVQELGTGDDSALAGREVRDCALTGCTYADNTGMAVRSRTNPVFTAHIAVNSGTVPGAPYILVFPASLRAASLTCPRRPLPQLA
jgi:hypothetical protein